MGTQIQCGCGCGTWISKKGKNGKPRKYLKGHQTKGRKVLRDDAYLLKRLTKLNDGRFCECGCSKPLLLTFDWLKSKGAARNLYPPKFLEGHMPRTFCECGCGEEIDAFSARGLPRSYVPAHAGKAARGVLKVDWTQRLQTWQANAPLCACGCGQVLTRTEAQLKFYLKDPKYSPGHHRRRACVQKLTQKERDIIFGSLLGDMSISRPKETPRLQFTHSQKQRAYATHKAEELGRLGWLLREQKEPTSFGGFVLQGSSSCMPVLDEVWQVVRSGGAGKVVTKRWLEEVGELGLAFWFMDDGSVGRKRGVVTHSAFHTEGFTFSENHLLCDWLFSRFGVTAQVKSTRTYFYLYLPREETNFLLEKITPHLCPSMAYKGLKWQS